MSDDSGMVKWGARARAQAPQLPLLDRAKLWVNDLVDPPPDQPGWQKDDPRYQYEPGELQRSHVPQVPRFQTPGEAEAWAAQRFPKMPVQLDTASDWRDAGAGATYRDGFGRVALDARWPERRAKDLEAFHEAAVPLSRAYEAGVRMPSKLQVQDERQGGDFRVWDATMGFFRPSNRSMHLNAAFLRDEPGHTEDTVLHELGHVNDPRAMDRWPWTAPDDVRAAKGVSEYAATAPDEFVASAYARQAAGKALPEGAGALYGKLQGPTIPKLLAAPMDVEGPPEDPFLAAARRRARRR